MATIRIKTGPLRMDHCGNCRYYAPEVDRELPETCRIQGAPTLIPFPGQHGQVGATSMWPTVKSSWWCPKWEELTPRDLENRASLNSDSN